MALGVAATFSSLSEAQVAAGALRAAGFDAQVFDDHFGTMMWLEQVALGGYRVIVPQPDQADAALYLHDVAMHAPRRRSSPRDKGVGWRGTALLGFAFGSLWSWGLGALFGLLIVGVKRRASLGGAVGLDAIVLISIVVMAAVAAATFLISYVGPFIYGWLIHPRI